MPRRPPGRPAARGGGGSMGLFFKNGKFPFARCFFCFFFKLKENALLRLCVCVFWLSSI